MKKSFVAVGILTVLLTGCTTQEGGNTQETRNVDTIESRANENIRAESVAYYGSTEGFYVEPTAEPTGVGSYPGVVMIHEWWGLNDNIKEMAKKLAQEGYQVLAVDLYNGKVAATSDEARTLTSSLDQEDALRNLKAAKAYLTNRDATKIGSLGWCFGGGQSLKMALSGEKLDATVIYYGQLETDKKKLGVINWPVLGIFGAEDTSIPVSTVEQFKVALTEAGIENSIHIYPGVGHAFANPSGANYAPQPTQDAWTKTLEFLDKNLKEKPRTTPKT